ncbi:MAG: SH3 domain-containing protein [Bacteroidia bacterium]|nr:SH3 domain-containing protein [Bacteroidia bacterium]
MKTILFTIAAILLTCSAAAKTWVVGAGEEIEHPTEAFDQVESGDTILIRKGEYHAEGFRIGQKANIVIIAEDAHLLGTQPYGTVLTIEGCRNIILSGLHMRHQTGAQWEICFGGVLQISGCQGIFITNCEMNGCGAIGLDVFGSVGVVCSNSAIHHNNKAAVRYEWKSFNDPDSMQFENLIMFRNEFSDNATISFLFPWVDGLRIRKSYPDGEVIGVLSAMERVYFLREKSKEETTIQLRGNDITAPWVKIQTNEGLVGWVFGGAIADTYEESEQFYLGEMDHEEDYEGEGNEEESEEP